MTDIMTISRKEIEGLTGVEFEELVSKMYEFYGHQCYDTPTSNDYGADVIVETILGKYSIQCKRQTSNVGIKAVQEVYGSMAKYSTIKGIVITTSGFTVNALELAKHCSIDMIDGDAFWQMITDIQNGNVLKNNKENIIELLNEIDCQREELVSEVNGVIDLAHNKILSFQNRMDDMIENNNSYTHQLKQVAQSVTTRLELLSNIPEPKQGEKGDQGIPGINASNTLSIVAIGLCLINIAITIITKLI